MDEYLLFVDETLKTSNNPYFCMSGVCIKRSYYENVVSKEINVLKKRHFGTTEVILHYSDINNKKTPFDIFIDGDKRTSFCEDYHSVIKKLDFTVIGVYFDQSKMHELYETPNIKCYDIAFIELLDNYLHFLKKVNGVGSICLESRTLKENAKLQEDYYKYLSNGSVYFSKKDFEKHLTSIGFFIKGDNCIGLQIADISPSALLRKINSSKDSYNIGEVYREKLYCRNTDNEDVLGLRNIL